MAISAVFGILAIIVGSLVALFFLLWYSISTPFRTWLNLRVSTWYMSLVMAWSIPAWLATFLRGAWNFLRWVVIVCLIIVGVFYILLPQGFLLYGHLAKNAEVLIFTFAIYAALLMIPMFALDGLARLLRTGRGMVEGLIAMMMWIGINLVFLTYPNDFYMKNLLWVGIGNLTLIMIWLRARHRNKPMKVTAGFLLCLYFVGLLGLMVQRDVLKLPDFLNRKIDKFQSGLNQGARDDEYRAKMVYRKFNGRGYGYKYNNLGFSILPNIQFEHDEFVLIADAADSLKPNGGEQMCEVYEQDTTGLFAGTGVYVAYGRLVKAAHAERPPHLEPGDYICSDRGKKNANMKPWSQPVPGSIILCENNTGTKLDFSYGNTGEKIVDVTIQTGSSKIYVAKDISKITFQGITARDSSSFGVRWERKGDILYITAS